MRRHWVLGHRVAVFLDIAAKLVVLAGILLLFLNLSKRLRSDNGCYRELKY
jgi:hypothetical protein